MNLLYLHSHDTGRYIQPYGYPVPTPRLQRFAEEGVLFRHAFCANPTCSPSRAALLSGQWAHQTGMIGLAHRGSRMFDYGRHLAAVLNDAGYDTVRTGQEHVDGGGQHAPYRQVRHGRGAPAERVVEEAVGFLAERHDRPFFLDAGFFLTHRSGPDQNGVEWHNGEKSPTGDPRYTRPPACLPDDATTRADFADYAVAAGRLDACYGRILDALEQQGLADDTLVVITTDHGLAFPRMKCNLTDHGTGVLLLMRGPGGFTGGRVLDALVSHIDVVPTICEVLGVTPPPWLAGHSLCPLLDGRAQAVRDEVFSEVNYHAAYEPMRAVRTTRHLLVRRYDARPAPVLPNCDDSVTKNVMLDAGWAEQSPPGEALYDLAFDPQAACNRAGDPALAGVLDDLRGRLDRWMADTDDPLLSGDGFVKPWPGMVVNAPDGASPRDATVPA